MDWTGSLKAQQQDFLARVKDNWANLICCELPGVYSELVIIRGRRLKNIHARCRRMVLKAEQFAPVRELCLQYLPEQLAQEAIAQSLGEDLIPLEDAENIKIDGTVPFAVAAHRSTRALVKVAGGSLESLSWSVSAEEIRENVAIACAWILEPPEESREEYRAILMGFVPTDGLAKDSSALHPGDLLYGGGLRSYLASVASDLASWEWMRALTGASSSVYPFAVAADGRSVATSGYDGTIKLWNLEDPELCEALHGESLSFYPLSTGGGGQPLASGSTEKKLDEVRGGTGRLIHTLKGHTSGVSSLAIAKDASLLISGGYDGTINLWKLDSGELLHSLAAHTGTVRPVVFSPDSALLASGSIDKTLKLWDVGSGRLIRTFETHSDPVISCAIARDGRSLVCGTQDGTIDIWNLETGESIRTIAGHSGIVRSLAIAADGETLASGSTERTIKLWNLHTGELIETLTGHPDPVIAFSLRSDGVADAPGDGPTLDLSVFRHQQPGWDDRTQG
jgi:hypothetical protein